MMCGSKTGVALIYGSILAFGIIGLAAHLTSQCHDYTGPIVDHVGWTPGPVSSYTDGVHGWLLWPGVTMMVCDALANLWFLVSWRKVWDAITIALRTRFHDGRA